MKTLLIRADASIRSGTGHVMRCLALGQAWTDSGGSVVFITADPDAGLSQRLEQERFEIRHAQPGDDPDDWPAADWVALDGYHFTTEYQARVKERNRLLVIDDTAHLSHYSADLLLNQNLGAEQFDYSISNGAELLLGPAYALLRREFPAAAKSNRDFPSTARRILITLGGSDPDNVTFRILGALNDMDAEIVVVAGAYNPHLLALRSAAAGQRSTRVETGVENMAALMAWADVAVSAAGSTCWELACMGLPAVLVVLAQNQEAIAEGMSRYGCAVNLGWHASAGIDRLADTLSSLAGSMVTRRRMSESGRANVDGLGSVRVAGRMMSAQ